MGFRLEVLPGAPGPWRPLPAPLREACIAVYGLGGTVTSMMRRAAHPSGRARCLASTAPSGLRCIVRFWVACFALLGLGRPALQYQAPEVALQCTV